MTEFERLAMGIFLPVATALETGPGLLHFLDNGGQAILFGEDAEEFASGRMRPERLARETPEAWTATISDLRARAGALIVACDADMAAVNRLHGVAGDLPDPEEAQALAEEELVRRIAAHAGVARTLGVTMFLSPTADLVTGANAWLKGRTLARDPKTLARLVGANVRGIRQGGVMSALKHFPGHPSLAGHPAKEIALVPGDLDTLRRHMGGFAAGIAAGAEAVVLSSARYEAVSPPEASSLSGRLVAMLREELGFGGLVVTLDLDHPSCQGGRSLAETCALALLAGTDLLLVSPAAPLAGLARAIAGAVDAGRLPEARLRAAHAAVAAAAR